VQLIDLLSANAVQHSLQGGSLGAACIRSS
jgi:hypothetical protein